MQTRLSFFIVNNKGPKARTCQNTNNNNNKRSLINVT